MAKKKDSEVTIDCRTSERRGNDRRKKSNTVAEERRTDPRRKVQRRRQIDPTTCERDYNDEEIEFMHALDDYKRANGRMFPTCSEILEVIRGLGYQKVADIEVIESTDLVEEPEMDLSDEAEFELAE